MTWHTDGTTLQAYQAGTLAPAGTASVEAHLAGCADCRAVLAGFTDRPRLDRNWSAISDRLDERTTNGVERALVRLGMRSDRARLIVMTPAMRSPAFLGLAAVLAMASVVSAADGTRDRLFYLFLVMAPLLPVAGVAAAFGSGADPGRELVATTPLPAFELLLVRTLAVVAVTTAMTTATALPLMAGWEAVVWLLPALGLTATALALSTWVAARSAAVGLGVAWVLAAAVSWQANRFDPDVLARFVALRPAGQVLFAAVTVVGASVFLVRRNSLDLRRFA